MKYFDLIRDNKLVRRLLLVEFIATFGAWFSNVGIYTLLVEFNSSKLTIALITAMHFLPAVLLAPINGAIIDRAKLKTLMFSLLIVELIMTLMFLTISQSVQIWNLGFYIFIKMLAVSIYFGAQMSLFAKILKGKSLQKANELNSMIWSVTYAAGMAISGFVVHALGVKVAFLIDAIFYLVAIFIFIRTEFPHISSKAGVKILNLVKEGFLYIKENKIVWQLIILHSAVGITSFDTLITLLAKIEYKEIIAVPLAIGLSNASRAIALMIGPYLISNYVTKKTLHYFLLFQGASIILWAFLEFDFYLSLIAQFFVGITTTTLWAYTYALLQENCNEEYLGRVIAYNDMSFMAVCVIITLFTGYAATFISLQATTICLGIFFFFFALYYKFSLREKILD